MKQEKDFKQISIPIPIDLHRRMKIFVAHTDMLVKDFITEAIREALNRRGA